MGQDERQRAVDAPDECTARPPARGRSAALFPEGWWGIVVYSCFDSTTGAAAVAASSNDLCHRLRPKPCSKRSTSRAARSAATESSPRQGRQAGARGGVRRPRARSRPTSWPGRLRYSLLAPAAAKLRQWGRTTSFDLLLRAGALGIGGQQYKPDYAYFGGSTGPKSGFARVFGEALDTDERVAWAESLLRHWTRSGRACASASAPIGTARPLRPATRRTFSASTRNAGRSCGICSWQESVPAALAWRVSGNVASNSDPTGRHGDAVASN